MRRHARSYNGLANLLPQSTVNAERSNFLVISKQWQAQLYLPDLYFEVDLPVVTPRRRKGPPGPIEFEP